LAVNSADVATPDAFVTAVFAFPAKAPLAPAAGGLNVTVTPLSKLPPASFTVASRRFANAVLTPALCGVPPVAVIDAAGPGLFISAKLAGVVTPAADAVTT
jgi:hypothetical protein